MGLGTSSLLKDLCREHIAQVWLFCFCESLVQVSYMCNTVLPTFSESGIATEITKDTWLGTSGWQIIAAYFATVVLSVCVNLVRKLQRLASVAVKGPQQEVSPYEERSVPMGNCAFYKSTDVPAKQELKSKNLGTASEGIGEPSYGTFFPQGLTVSSSIGEDCSFSTERPKKEESDIAWKSEKSYGIDAKTSKEFPRKKNHGGKKSSGLSSGGAQIGNEVDTPATSSATQMAVSPPLTDCGVDLEHHDMENSEGVSNQPKMSLLVSINLNMLSRVPKRPTTGTNGLQTSPKRLKVGNEKDQCSQLERTKPVQTSPTKGTSSVGVKSKSIEPETSHSSEDCPDATTSSDCSDGRTPS